jgi:hypothetical protein
VLSTYYRNLEQSKGKKKEKHLFHDTDHLLQILNAHIKHALHAFGLLHAGYAHALHAFGLLHAGYAHMISKSSWK